MKTRLLCAVYFLTLGVITIGCQKVFEYTPYSSQLADGYDELTTQKNLEKLDAHNENEAKPFTIALLSDTHDHYTELKMAVDAINSRSDIAFTIIAGDMSDQGMEKEYMLLYDQLKRLKQPLLTVIGNHEYLANAATIYQKMFGPVNYSFTYSSYKFIYFDSNFWEKNGCPDFDWLNAELTATDGATPILISHIPPFGDQYDTTSTRIHRSLTSRGQVPLSIHGHIHRYSYNDYFGDGTNYLVVPSLEKRELCLVTFDAGKITVRRERF